MATILVVDDYRVNLHMLRHILRKHGYAVQTASDGEAAVSILKSSPIDLILSDILMPIMDGFALTEWVRDSAEYATIPIIMLTATGDDENQNRATSLGVNGFLTQPFDSVTMMGMVKNLLGTGE